MSRNETVVSVGVNKKIVYKPVPSHADLLTVEDFVNLSAVGALTADDGDAYYATETEMSNVSAWNNAPGDHTHVAWFSQ